MHRKLARSSIKEVLAKKGLPAHLAPALHSFVHFVDQLKWRCEELLSSKNVEELLLIPSTLARHSTELLREASLAATAGLTAAWALGENATSKRVLDHTREIMDAPVLMSRLQAYVEEHREDEFATMQDLFNLTADENEETEDSDE